MGRSYLKQLKLAIILSSLFALPQIAIAAPSDNDESYQLPAYVPQVALPKNGKKIIFKDKPSDNDEVYAAPQTSSKPALNPTAQAEYQKKYAEYQKQLAVYNQQMAEYKKALAARQSKQIDNDSAYALPGQYRNVNPTPTVPPPQNAQQYQQRYDYNDQKQYPGAPNQSNNPYNAYPNSQGLPDLPSYY